MYRNYFAHYTFIYPDILLKNSVVKLDETGCLIGYHAFEKETQNTFFHSGLQVFLPLSIAENITRSDLLQLAPSLESLWNEDTLIIPIKG
jgi:hypothetical protein